MGLIPVADTNPEDGLSALVGLLILDLGRWPRLVWSRAVGAPCHGFRINRQIKRYGDSQTSDLALATATSTFLCKIVRIDPLHLVGGGDGDSEVVVNHQASQIFAVNEDQFDVAQTVRVIPGISREL